MVKSTPSAKYPTDTDGIRNRICHVLSIYPNINGTMLQVGLGVGFRPVYWRPVLNQMIQNKEVVQVEEMRRGPTGRYNMYTFLRLSDKLQAQFELGTEVEAPSENAEVE